MNKVAVLAGDGIGPEVMDVAIKVLKKALEVENKLNDYTFEEALVGGAAIDAAGHPLPEKTLNICKKSDAILFGSVGGPKWEDLPPDRQPERGALLPLRKEFKLFANIRPAIIYPELQAASPLKADRIGTKGLNILILRELTGGIYFGSPKGREGSEELEKAYDTLVYEKYEIERIARLAFEAARARANKVTSIDKANVLTSMVFWREVVSELHKKEYSDVELNHLYVDNGAMQLVVNPRQFDVLLCGNMFGDILSDEASVITGSIGMLPSASLSVMKDGRSFGMYEPSGGSAPDIQGQNKANPIAQVLSAALMMRYSFAEEGIAGSIENAVSKTISDGVRTFDIQGDAPSAIGTKEMGEEITKRF